MDQVLSSSLNRPVRTRMPGAVGRAGERPALTRFRLILIVYHNLGNNISTEFGDNDNDTGFLVGAETNLSSTI